MFFSGQLGHDSIRRYRAGRNGVFHLTTGLFGIEYSFQVREKDPILLSHGISVRHLARDSCAPVDFCFFQFRREGTIEVSQSFLRYLSGYNLGFFPFLREDKSPEI